ncbi:MAG: bifunctional DedA family/phosphatase PAP2 family protein [Gammaproteobacteria bacterium]
MYDFISPILQWINTHPELAGFATFLISAAESIAIIGTIVPGTVMMTAIGTLAGSGVMPLWSTIIWAILGAIVGDGISYWIGYHFKDRLRVIWPFRNYPNLLESGVSFFHKHGGKSVFIGRFVGPVRALVPLVAGMLQMKPWRFVLANVTSAIGWAPAYMLPGIMLGAASLELPPDIAVHAILMLLLIGLFILFCLWFIQKLFRLIGNQINQALTHVWRRLSQSRYFSLITILFRHYNPTKTYGQLTLVFYLIITGVLFLYLMTYVSMHGSHTIFINNFFYYLFRSLRNPTGDSVMVGITLLGEYKVLLPMAAGLFIWLAWTKRWHTAWHVFALAILTMISVETIKHLVHSPRPWGILQSPSSPSFPSGHATFSTAFFLGMALLIVKTLKQQYRRTIYTFTSLVIIAVCISRIYLGAHWLTDVIGGVLLGASILMLVVLSYNRQAEKNLPTFGIITTSFVTLLLSYSLYFDHNYSVFKQHYKQIDWPTYSITVDSWWNQRGEHLPFYRLNRFGLTTQILNLQWIENLEKIRTLLIQGGWEVPPERDWINALHRISNVQSTEHVPLLAPLYLDKDPVLVLIKHTANNKKLMVLRLWNSNVTMDHNAEPLWVGTVEIVPSTYSWLFKRKRSNDVDLTTKLLFSTAPQHYDIKRIIVENTHRRKPEKQAVVLIKPKHL